MTNMLRQLTVCVVLAFALAYCAQQTDPLPENSPLSKPLPGDRSYPRLR